jgi:hypothetical protein
MMPREKWEEAIKAWERVKAQAEIDIYQANLYLAAIKIHLDPLDPRHFKYDDETESINTHLNTKTEEE